jgi:hypothetical protein
VQISRGCAVLYHDILGDWQEWRHRTENLRGLTSFCREAGKGENNGRRCPKPKPARTEFLPNLDFKLSISSIHLLNKV